MNYTPIPNEFLQEMEELSDAEYGRLIRWAQTYQLTGEATKLPGNERFFAKRVQMQVDRYTKSYNEKCEKARESARKRWDASACERMPTDAEQCEPVRSDADDAKPKPKPKTKPTSDDTCARVIEAWNSLGLSKVNDIFPDSVRHKNLKARINQYGEEAIFNVIEKVKSSSFLRGQSESGWQATFDWLVKPSNFQKVLEGQYDDRKKQVKSNMIFNGDHSKAIRAADGRTLFEVLAAEEAAYAEGENDGVAV